MEKQQFGSACIYLADAFEVIDCVDRIDCVITDPPYCSGARTAASIRARGAMTRGDRWADAPIFSDQMTTTGLIWLMRAIAMSCTRKMRDGGSFLSFCDWRQYPQFFGALESTNLRIQQLVVWDKEVFGMGNGFRSQHELIIHAAKGVPIINERGIGNVIRSKRIASSDVHPTEKPEQLFAPLISVVSSVGDLVFDPFAGSAPIGAAAVKMGRRYIGAEIERRHFDAACARLERAAALNLVTALPEQSENMGLF